MEKQNNITITKDIELINLYGYIFKDKDGNNVTYTENYYGFLVNNRFVSSYCKSAGGSSLPMAYNIRIALDILKSGLVVEELAYCEPVNKKII